MQNPRGNRSALAQRPISTWILAPNLVSGLFYTAFFHWGSFRGPCDSLFLCEVPFESAQNAFAVGTKAHLFRRHCQWEKCDNPALFHAYSNSCVVEIRMETCMISVCPNCFSFRKWVSFRRWCNAQIYSEYWAPIWVWMVRFLCDRFIFFNDTCYIIDSYSGENLQFISPIICIYVFLCGKWELDTIGFEIDSVPIRTGLLKSEVTIWITKCTRPSIYWRYKQWGCYRFRIWKRTL